MLIVSALQREKEFQPLLSSLQKEKKPVLVTGVTSSLRELFPAAVLHKTGGKALILLPDEREASEMANALSSVFERTYFFPPRDFSLVRMDSSSRDFSLKRLEALTAVIRGEFDVVVTTFEAACQATLPPEVMRALGREIAVGDEVTKEELIACLLDAGYEETHRVEGAGQFATRGDIVDVFPADRIKPCRIELFGDEIDAIGVFDVVTQRRSENLTSFFLPPAQEILFSAKDRLAIADTLKEKAEQTAPSEKEKRVYIRSVLEHLENGLDFAKDLFLSLVYRFSTLFDYFHDEMIFVYDQSFAKERLTVAENFLREQLLNLYEDNKSILPPKEIALLMDFSALCDLLSQRRVILMENFFGGKSSFQQDALHSFICHRISICQCIAYTAGKTFSEDFQGFK
jgi:transcription-repair coupling factor (superfamily II helicase)